jgi:hypothetical protein
MNRLPWILTTTLLLFGACEEAFAPYDDDFGAPAAVGGKADELADETDLLEETLLAYVNEAGPAELAAAGLDSRQVSNVVAARPIASVAALAAVPHVGNATLRKLLASAAPDEVAAGAGFWDQVLLGPGQAAAALEMADGAALLSLGCDLGFSESMAARIVDGRPYASLDELVAVRYVGSAQIARLKAWSGWWVRAEAIAHHRYDCVAFTDEQAAAGLDVANWAGYGQLGGNLYGLLEPGRPFSDLGQVAAVRGIGPHRMSRLRALADRQLQGEYTPAPDSIRGLLGGQTSSPLVLGAVRVLGAEPSGIWRVFHYSGGVSLEVPCVRVADHDDPTPHLPGRSALYCHESISSQWQVDFHEMRAEDALAFADSLEHARAAGVPVVPGTLVYEVRAGEGPFLFRRR